MNEKKQGGFKLIYVVILLAVALLFALLFVDFGNNGKHLTKQTEIYSIIDGTYQGKDGTEKAAFLYYKNGKAYILIEGSKYDENDVPSYSDYYFNYDARLIDEVLTRCDKNNVTTQYAPTGVNFWDILVPILYIAFAIFVFYFLYRMVANANKGAMSFGKTKIKSYSMTKVKFSDIAGMDEEKAELQEVVEFLKNPAKFTSLGARIPKGVLLVGQPGTGKTLLARAVAGESRVPFISISGSDFVEMFVGVGASRVRDLFDQAKKNKPCIVFIDEIDAVGRQRGAGLGGGHDEREQTLNQLLVEMDGFDGNTNIIILAATNRPDILDNALLRPGRFDRQIMVSLPDVKGREKILEVHAKGKPLDKDVDLKVLAKRTPGFTGADLQSLLNESALLAARRNKSVINMAEIDDAIDRVIAGIEKKSKVMTDEDKEITSYHEVGHALLAKLLKDCDELHKVTIIPRGYALGITWTKPEDNKVHVSKAKLLDQITMILGGRVAEEIVYGADKISTGASSDLEKVTGIAKKMVTAWGMSEKMGAMTYGKSQEHVFMGRDFGTTRDFSEEIAADLDREVKKIIDERYNVAKQLLTENRDLLEAIAKELLEKETLDDSDVTEIIIKVKGEEFNDKL